MPCRVTWESTRFDREQGKCGRSRIQNLDCVFRENGKPEQGSSLGLAHLNNVGRLWVLKMASSCLYLALGCLRAEEYWLLECNHLVEEVVLNLGSGLSSLHVKGVFPSTLLSLRIG